MDTWRTSKVFDGPGIMLITVEQTNFHKLKSNTNFRLYANVLPVAVIVCSPDRTYALDMNSNPTDLDLLKQKIPELKNLIDSS